MIMVHLSLTFSGSGELSTINSVDDFHFSDINPVLINHALVEMGLVGNKVIVMCGLPYGDYFKKTSNKTVRK